MLPYFSVQDDRKLLKSGHEHMQAGPEDEKLVRTLFEAVGKIYTVSSLTTHPLLSTPPLACILIACAVEHALLLPRVDQCHQTRSNAS